MAIPPVVTAPLWRPVLLDLSAQMLRVVPSRRTGPSLKTGKDEGLGFAAWLDHSDAKPEASLRPALARRQRYIRLNISIAVLGHAAKRFRRHCEIGRQAR